LKDPGLLLRAEQISDKVENEGREVQKAHPDVEPDLLLPRGVAVQDLAPDLSGGVHRVNNVHANVVPKFPNEVYVEVVEVRVVLPALGAEGGV